MAAWCTILSILVERTNEQYQICSATLGPPSKSSCSYHWLRDAHRRLPSHTGPSPKAQGLCHLGSRRLLPPPPPQPSHIPSDTNMPVSEDMKRFRSVRLWRVLALTWFGYAALLVARKPTSVARLEVLGVWVGTQGDTKSAQRVSSTTPTPVLGGSRVIICFVAHAVSVERHSYHRAPSFPTYHLCRSFRTNLPFRHIRSASSTRPS